MTTASETPTGTSATNSGQPDGSAARPPTHSIEQPFRSEPEHGNNTAARAGVQCRLLPHGAYAVIPALLSTFAWLASLSQDGCDYARLKGPIVNQLSSVPDVPFLDVGFNQFRTPTRMTDGTWVVDYRSPCEDYVGDFAEADIFWKFAKGTGFLSLIFGGGGALFLWFSSCFVFSRGTWRWAGYELLAATVFQLLTFMWFNTAICHGNDGEDSCSLFYGSKTDILASCFWAVSVFAIFYKYPKAASTRQARGDASTAQMEMERQSSSGSELPLEGRVVTRVSESVDDAESLSTVVDDNEHEII